MSEPKPLKDVASYLVQAAESSAGRRWRPPKKINALRPYKNEILEAYEKGLTFRQIAEIFTSRGHKISMAQIGRAIRLFLDEDLRAENTGPQAKEAAKTLSTTNQQDTQLSVRAPRKFALVMEHGDVILEALQKGKSIEEIRQSLAQMPNGFYVSVADLGRAIRLLRKGGRPDDSSSQTPSLEETASASYAAPSKRLISEREKLFAQELLRGRRAAGLSRRSFNLPQPTRLTHTAPDPFSKIKRSPQRPVKNREEALARQRKPKRKIVATKAATSPKKPGTPPRRRSGR